MVYLKDWNAMEPVTWVNERAQYVAASMIAAKLQIRGQRIAFHRDPAPEKIGRILLPEESKPKFNSGTVVSVGEKTTIVKVGDRIWFTKYGGVTFDVPLPDGETGHIEICHEDDIYITSDGPQ